MSDMTERTPAIDNPDSTRRNFMVGAIALTSGLLLAGKGQSSLAGAPASEAALGAVEAMRCGQPQLVLFDPERSDACRNVSASVAAVSTAAATAATPATANATATSAAARPACAVRAIEGDRVRLAREVFGVTDAPAIVVGHTTYADFILISGSAAEHGYRVLSEEGVSTGSEGVLVTWKIGRLRSVAAS